MDSGSSGDSRDPGEPHDPTGPETDADGALRRGLRFTNQMAMATRREGIELAKEVYTLLETLLDKGVISLADLRQRHQLVAQRIGSRAARELPAVELAPPRDKYQVEPPKDLDCAALIPTCQARCCSLSFVLSEQDLDEGIVRWTVQQPYRIRQRPSDGCCSHQDPTSKGCTVYAHRPATCRIYDCRKDKRIWLDFEKRIINPDT